MPPALTAATPPDAPQRPNALSWSPTFPTTLLLPSEHYNLCTSDIRALFAPTQIYKAHVSTVMSYNWSPTGTEFVGGSWNRTARIWKEGVGGRPELYHTKRMQRYVPLALRLTPVRACGRMLHVACPAKY